MSKNKSWRQLKLSSEYVYIKNGYMFVSYNNGVLCQFLQFLTKWWGYLWIFDQLKKQLLIISRYGYRLLSNLSLAVLQQKSQNPLRIAHC